MVETVVKNWCPLGGWKKPRNRVELQGRICKKNVRRERQGEGNQRFEILSRSRTNREIDETKARNTSDTLENVNPPRCTTRPTVTIMKEGGYKLEKKGKERGGEEIGGPRKRGRFSGLEEFLEDRRFKRSEDFESAKWSFERMEEARGMGSLM